jgi:hypothetical protein
VDGQRFDDLARVLSARLNRKGFLALVAGVAAPTALSADVTAKKHKRRNRGNGGGGAAPQGFDEAVCSGECTKDAECPDSPDCMCDLETNRCQTVLCGGSCLKDDDCQDLPGCTCQFINGPENPGACGTETCSYYCNKGECRSGQPEGDSCVCDFETDTCVTIACPGFCEDNADCQEQGQEDCACFFGSNVDVTSAAEVAAAVARRPGPAGPGGLGAEGGSGPTGPTGPVCGACLLSGAACNASTECCGQLVCRDAGNGPSQEGIFVAGTCQRKPKPKDRCSKHGGTCHSDHDCCAQGVCFKGECGEKDTHCHNDSECARGYRCQGGPLSPGHRRCRKNGRRNRNRRNANGKKR